MAEGATADEESTGGVNTGEVSDIRPRRLPNWAENILKYLPWVSVAMGFISIVVGTRSFHHTIILDRGFADIEYTEESLWIVHPGIEQRTSGFLVERICRLTYISRRKPIRNN